MLSQLRRALPASLLALASACGGGVALPGAPPLPPLGLAYPTVTPVAETGVPFTLAPSIQGEFLTWSSSPALPAGLSLYPVTGVVSGTPTQKTGLNAYTITATNESGSDSTALQLIVNDAGAPTDLTYPQSNYDFGVGSAIAPATPTVTGPVLLFSIVPSLPAGLSIDGATGTISGTPSQTSLPIDYVVQATNTNGSDLTLLRIAVSATGPPTAIDYAENPAFYVENQPISANTPTVTGFATKYEVVVVPAQPPYFYNPLPQGLSLNPNTGVISGTPQMETGGPLLHLVRATNSFPGQAIVEIEITVLDENSPPQNLKYSQNPALYTVGDPITPNVPTVLGNVNFYTVDTTTDPPLPAGLVLDSLTGEISGTPAQSKAFGPHTIRADNTFGSTAAKVFIQVDSARSHLLFTVNTGDATVSSLTLRSSDGRARHAGYGVTGPSPVDAVLSPDSRFLYVANFGGASLSSYTVDELSGSLGLPSTVPILGGSQPTALALSPAGDTLYVALGGGNLIVPFAVDSASGGLTEGVPTVSGGGVNAIAVSPDGGLLAATNSATNAVETFTLDAVTGAPTAADSEVTDSGPTGLVFSPDSAFLYVANNTSGTISQYAVSSLGVLTPLVPASVSSAVQTQSLAIPDGGSFLYAANTSGSITQYQVTGGGALAPLATPSVATDAGVWDISVDAIGETLYATNLLEQELVTYTIPASGELTLLETVRTRPQPIALAVGPGQSAVTERATHAFFANEEDGDVSSLLVDSNSGQVSNLAVVQPDVGTTPTGVTVTPDNRFAFVSGSGTNSVHPLDIDLVTGALTASQPAIFLGNGTSPIAVAMGPNGRHVYSVNISADDVVALDIDQVNGALTAGTSAATGSLPRNGTIDPTGRFMYSSNSFSIANDDVSILGLAAATGAISNQGAAGFGANANVWEVAVHPTGLYAYAVNSLAPGSIAQFEIDASTGALAPMATPIVGVGGSLKGVTIHPTGNFLFVGALYTANPKGRVIGLAIDPATGALSPTSWFSFGVGDDPIDLAVEASGKYLLVLSRGFMTLQSFAVNPATGALTLASQAAVGGKPRSFALTRVFE